MIADRLNDLLELETRGLIARLDKIYAFVDPRDTDAAAMFRRVHADQLDHQRLLTEAIAQCGGVPRPASMDMTSAGDHYLSARYLVPRLIDEQQQCVAACERVAGELSGNGAGAIVARVGKAHRQNLEELESFAERLRAAEVESVAATAQANDA